MQDVYRVPHEIAVRRQDVTKPTAVHEYSQFQLLKAVAENWENEENHWLSKHTDLCQRKLEWHLAVL